MKAQPARFVDSWHLYAPQDALNTSSADARMCKLFSMLNEERNTKVQYRDAEGARGMHEVGGRFQYSNSISQSISTPQSWPQ